MIKFLIYERKVRITTEKLSAVFSSVQGIPSTVVQLKANNWQNLR